MDGRVDSEAPERPGVLQHHLDAAVEGGAGQKIGDSQATIPRGGRVR